MTTNIDALPSQVTLETKEMPKQSQQLLSNKDAQQMVENLQIASNQKVTSLPPRDVPMHTIQAALDPRTQANYIPPHLRQQAAQRAAQREAPVDYIQEHDTVQEVLQRNQKKEEKISNLDALYDEIQTPLFVMLLFFVFQMPFFQKIMIRFMPSLFSADGHPTFMGFLVKTLLFGLVFYGVQKTTHYLSEI